MTTLHTHPGLIYWIYRVPTDRPFYGKYDMLCHDCGTIEWLRPNSTQTHKHMSKTLTCVRYCCTMSKEGTNHDSYGIKAGRMAHGQGNSQRTEGEGNSSSGMDSSEKASGLSIWQKTQSEEKRSGEIYRGQQNKQVAKNSFVPSKASASFLDGT